MQWNVFHSHLAYLSAKDQKRVEKAFLLGKEAHKGQKRRSGEPFFIHPIETAYMLTDMGADADTIIAALLHDTIEDTALTLPDIEENFGNSVAILIDGITKLCKEDVQGQPKADEQIETLRKIFTLMQKDIRIMVIKLTDRLHNMQTVEFLPKGKQQALARETLDVYVKIAERLSMQTLRHTLEGLCLSVLKPDLLNELNNIRLVNEEMGNGIIGEMDKAMRQKKIQSPAGYRMQYERKSWPRLLAQFGAGKGPVTGISDLTVVFLCNDVPGCYQILGNIHQLWKRETLSFEDYINAPQINGYRGLHTTVILEDGTRVRCKIRTEEMHDYAQKGVTKYCFDNKAKGVTAYMDWGDRIAPLSKDTEQRSEDFWASLQSDILGDSILIHGSGDQTMRVPKGATALDGICYLHGKDALRATEILVNGLPVKFYEELPYACSVSANLDAAEHVNFSWLRYAKTGIASAIIHKALSKADDGQKKQFGKDLLNETLLEHSHVGVDEISTNALTNASTQLGHKNSNDLLMGIAEGTVSPQEIAYLLFPSDKEKSDHEFRNRLWNIAITYPHNLNDEITRVLRRFRSRKLRYRDGDTTGRFRGQYLLNKGQQQELSSLLTTILGNTGWSLRLTASQIYWKGALFTVLLLWGLDPVIAKLILQQGVDAYGLTLIRFFTVFCTASLVLALQTTFRPVQLKRLSPFDSSLLLSGIALFTTALFSYLALSVIPASQYILFVVTGVVCMSMVECFREKNRKDRYCSNAILSLISILAAIAILSELQTFTLLSTFFAATSALGFTLYSFFSKKFLQEKAMVTARYPAFLFWLSLVGLVLSLVILPAVHPLQIYSAEQTSLTVLFVLVFNVIPYFLFFELLRRTESTIVGNALPFVCIATIAGEVLATGSLVPLVLLPFVLLFVWQFAVHLRGE
ncbi:hypothetical protein COU76_02765 [Candidatus Peregrinibacteria bacterium CG10_big_fil_rev_8_21_14_0_10_49_10]|nr:MAG: hypothetical protein COU76_02765 [Candidatus Peregrinibacteria bacterium CG10_big_fil_rev_8_21_14_0_10_49_10]